MRVRMILWAINTSLEHLTLSGECSEQDYEDATACLMPGNEGRMVFLFGRILKPYQIKSIERL